MTTLVFTDGACTGNGYKHVKASFATLINSIIIRGFVQPSEYVLLKNNSIEQTTVKILPSNNRAELLGIIYGFIYILKDIKETKNTDYILYSDSQICVKTINEWYDKREKKKTLHEFKNLDLLNIMMILYRQIQDIANIKCIHTRSHRKFSLKFDENEKKIWYGNNIVDKYATELLNSNSHSNIIEIINV